VLFSQWSISYRIFYFLQPKKFTNCDRKIKYSVQLLVVSISHYLGALSDLKYIGDTWNFFFETAPSADNCMVALITLPNPTFKKNLKWEDRPPISKIPTFQPVWKNCRLDNTTGIHYLNTSYRLPQ